MLSARRSLRGIQFSSPFSIAITSWGKELILVLFVRLFDLRLFAFVCFLFLLVSGKGCGLRLWHCWTFLSLFFFYFSSPEHNVNYCDRPVSGVRRPQFASNDISSVTTGRISTKVDRIAPVAVLCQNCSNLSAPLLKMATRAKNRKTKQNKKKKKKKKKLLNDNSS